MASAKPRPISIGTRIGPATSGLRPIDSMALPTPKPMPMPGPMAPKPMARAGAQTFMVLAAAACCARKPISGTSTSELRMRFATRGSGAASRVTLVRCRDRQEYQRQHREDQRLDKADEQFESKECEERKRRYPDHRRHEDFAGEDVAKQPERQRERPGNYLQP